VVATPLAVALGETAPHGVGEHDTVQVTPLFAGSLVTVAVTCVVAPACTVVVPAETETLIAGGGVELVPPPHPKLLTTRTRTTSNSWIPTNEMRFSGDITSLSVRPLTCPPRNMRPRNSATPSRGPLLARRQFSANPAQPIAS
jgi:hypothetical protein